MNKPYAQVARFSCTRLVYSRADCRSGGTLLELAVCVLIIGLIAIASLDFRKQVAKAKVASVVSTAKVINELATVIYNTTGSWPTDCPPGVCPSEMVTHLQQTVFLSESPMGGRWDWNGAGGDLPGEIGISLRFDSMSDATRNLLADIDRMIDNNNLGTGSCRQIEHNGGSIYLFSATSE